MSTVVKLNKITDEVVSSVLRMMPGKVYKIFLYGSYARGDNTAESDIDIMVILDCGQEQIKQFRKLFISESSRIGLENDVLVSVKARTKQDFVDMQDHYPFYRNIIQEGVELYDSAA